MDTSKYTERERERLIRILMNDTCQIVPSTGTTPVIADGILTSDVPTPKLWRTLTDIPCRFDESRAFKNEGLPSQTTVVDEYRVELPHDVDLNENDWIIRNNRSYEVRKLVNASTYRLSTVALCMDISTEVDDGSV